MVGQLANKFCSIWKRKFNWLVQGSALSNPVVICLNPVHIVILCVPMLPFNMILTCAHKSPNLSPFFIFHGSHILWNSHRLTRSCYMPHPLNFSDALIPFPVIKSKALVINLLISSRPIYNQ